MVLIFAIIFNSTKAMNVCAYSLTAALLPDERDARRMSNREMAVARIRALKYIHI